jgi:tetratricopeptide (TPR) repeat protein
MLYEELSKKDWSGASQHAISCYNFYLDVVDPEDPAILTRLGNMQLTHLDPQSALKTYQKALQVDPNLYNVQFNMAHAQIKLGVFARRR